MHGVAPYALNGVVDSDEQKAISPLPYASCHPSCEGCSYHV